MAVFHWNPAGAGILPWISTPKKPEQNRNVPPSRRGLGRLDVEYVGDEEEEGQVHRPPTRIGVLVQRHQGGTDVLDRPQPIAAAPSDEDRDKTEDGAVCPFHPEHLRGGEVGQLHAYLLNYILVQDRQGQLEDDEGKTDCCV